MECASLRHLLLRCFVPFGDLSLLLFGILRQYPKKFIQPTIYKCKKLYLKKESWETVGNSGSGRDRVRQSQQRVAIQKELSRQVVSWQEYKIQKYCWTNTDLKHFSTNENIARLRNVLGITILISHNGPGYAITMAILLVTARFLHCHGLGIEVSKIVFLLKFGEQSL